MDERIIELERIVKTIDNLLNDKYQNLDNSKRYLADAIDSYEKKYNTKLEIRF